MKVRVVPFASLRELVAFDSRDIVVEEGATVGQAWDVLASHWKEIAPFAESTRLARNGRVVSDRSEPLHDGDELSLLPPVGGG